ADGLAKGTFGKMGNAGSKPDPRAKVEPPKIPTSFDFALGQVKIDKTEVVLKPGGTAQVTLTNDSAGTVELTVAQTLPGTEVTLDQAILNKGEKAVATVKAGDNPHQGGIAFKVSPTGELVAFAV